MTERARIIWKNHEACLFFRIGNLWRINQSSEPVKRLRAAHDNIVKLLKDGE